jgi:DNA ligase-1
MDESEQLQAKKLGIVPGETKHVVAEKAKSYSFRTYCEVLDKVEQTRGTKAKQALFVELLRDIQAHGSLNDGVLACRFVSEGAFNPTSGLTGRLGARSQGLWVSEYCEIDYDIVFKPCRTATGSGSETIELLLTNMPQAIEKRAQTHGQPTWTLHNMDASFEMMAQAKKSEEKRALFFQWLDRLSPLEMKMALRMLGGGSLRIGFEARSLLQTLAMVSGASLEDIRYAHMVLGSVSETARFVFEERLGEASFTLFRPIAFMLASPVDSLDAIPWASVRLEEKLDGIRCQAHATSDRVELFSRDLNPLTQTFPDVVDELATSQFILGSSFVVDGEVLAFDPESQTILPFLDLQKRLGVKKPSSKLIHDVPVIFVAYDLLVLDEDEAFSHPLKQRRSQLISLCEKGSIAYSRQFEVATTQQCQRAFEQALRHGNEGLMIKQTDSSYAFGQRSHHWQKLKEPEGALDTIIMYAHAGSGKRGGTYSDFTLGVSVENDDRFSESYIPIGKAYGGYTNAELRTLNQELKKLVVEKFGPTLSLRPGIVVELEFDSIQVNKRTKAGYTLRFPRFRSIRWDLGPEGVDTLHDVERLAQKKSSMQRPSMDSLSDKAPIILPN